MTLLRRLRLTLLVAFVLCAAAVLLATRWHGAVGLTFWFWLGVCLAGELLWLRLPLGHGLRAGLDVWDCRWTLEQEKCPGFGGSC